EVGPVLIRIGGLGIGFHTIHRFSVSWLLSRRCAGTRWSIGTTSSKTWFIEAGGSGRSAIGKRLSSYPQLYSLTESKSTSSPPDSASQNRKVQIRPVIDRPLEF